MNPPFEFNPVGSVCIHRLTFSDLQLYGKDLSLMIQWFEDHDEFDNPIFEQILIEKNAVNKELGRRCKIA